jgi:hypothetical protein
MRDAAPSIPMRVYKKLKGWISSGSFRRYKKLMRQDHPFRRFPLRNVGDASADPTETLDHYDAFAYWAARKIDARGARLAILDVGSTKIMNVMFSAQHDVTSVVLSDCGDQISPVRYVRGDVSAPLPLPEASFDVFTSTVALPLVGLGRYGDVINPDCLFDLLAELGRVLRKDADLLCSMCLGKNVLNFNNGWFFDLETIKAIFGGWQLTDYLIDNWSSPRGTFASEPVRFTTDANLEHSPLGDYRVIFLHFRRLSRT